MKRSSSSRTAFFVAYLTRFVFLAIFALGLGVFQNCSPPLPSESMSAASLAALNATPVPIVYDPEDIYEPTTGGSDYRSVTWEGICVSDHALEPMATAGTAATGRLILFTNAGKVAIWHASASGLNTSNVCYMTEAGWYVAAVGDFDYDGHQDILWRNDTKTSANLIVWLLRNGVRVDGGVIGSMPDLNWKIVATGDFNKDRKADLVWQYQVDGSRQLVTWLMNGKTVTRGVGLGATEDALHFRGVGDFNGDQMPDVAFKHDNGAIRVWMMNQTTVTAAYDYTQPAGSWDVLGTADFDSDGKAEVYLGEAATRNIRFWKLNAAAVVDSVPNGATAPQIPSSLDFTPLLVWDLDVDGRADVVYQNNDNMVTVYKTSGATQNPFSGVISFWMPIAPGWSHFLYPRY